MNEYKSLPPDQLEALFSKFLINSWSFSKLSTFARNEKAFEMQYVYGIFSKRSATSVAGNAYHSTLQYYFTQKKEGKTVDLPELEALAFSYIDNVEANKWKIQKTTATVEECMIKATKTAGALLANFYLEKATYEDDIDEILDIEIRCDEWLTVNGVDIPLPCHAIIDMVYKNKEGKVCIDDHKSKAAYTSEEEMALSIGRQAITYILSYEAKTGLTVDQVRFIENKSSKNSDKSPQLHAYTLTVDENTRRLYEALLYEPLRRMIQAVSDPDYVYLINDADNYTDRAEIYDFWAKTMISEVDEFNVEDAKKELVAKRLKKIRDSSIAGISPNVIKSFKENASKFIQYDLSNKNMTAAEKIEHVLRSFGIVVRVAHIFDGYSSNSYLLEVSAGVKISSIHQRKLDIANALDVSNVRIGRDLSVHEGKSYLAIDFSKKRERSLVYDASELQGMRIPLGKDNFGNTIHWNLENHSTPHMLVCGATGSGKSVMVQSIIEYAREANVDRIVIFDPKYEFTHYAKSYARISVYNEIIDIEEQMAELVENMQDMVKSGKKEMTLVIFDEFADAVANSRKGNDLRIYEFVQTGVFANGIAKRERSYVGELKSLEENMRILLQKGRSIGFRIVAATQRASVKVITGDAKVNFPVQVCFRVPKEQDSRVVLDEAGAESLAGMGDGLIKSPEYNDIVRFQGYYVDRKIATA